MKKLFLIGLAVVMLGCKIPAVFPIGTTEADSKKSSRGVELVSATAGGTTIYRVNRRTFDSLNSPLHSFYFFYNGKLVRYEQSDNAEDYKNFL